MTTGDVGALPLDAPVEEVQKELIALVSARTQRSYRIEWTDGRGVGNWSAALTPRPSDW
jgi:hypothetical protein